MSFHRLKVNNHFIIIVNVNVNKNIILNINIRPSETGNFPTASFLRLVQPQVITAFQNHPLHAFVDILSDKEAA